MKDTCMVSKPLLNNALRRQGNTPFINISHTPNHSNATILTTNCHSLCFTNQRFSFEQTLHSITPPVPAPWERSKHTDITYVHTVHTRYTRANAVFY